MWFGAYPRVHVVDPEQLKAAVCLVYDIQKPGINPFLRFLLSGLVSLEGQKWAKHRKIINPAFHFQKLKVCFISLYLFTNFVYESKKKVKISSFFSNSLSERVDNKNKKKT